MADRYSRRFRVRHYELDALGHVNNVVFVRYMQEAAIEAAADVGFSPEWCRERGTGWLVRRLSVRYHGSLTYGDEVEVGTWVSEMRGVRSLREYDLTRTQDGTRVARGRAEWVYMDFQTGLPARFPREHIGRFDPTGEVEDLGVRPGNCRPTENAYRYVSERRVQFHELDPAQHVNHATYLEWIGQAYFDAIRAAGHPLERMRQEGWMGLQAGHDIEYLAPARERDNIRIVSWICEMGKVRGAWTHEISNADTGKLLARDYSLGVFVTPEGKPIVPPAQAVADVVRGPKS